MLSSAASFAGSQMFEIGRDLWKSSGPTPLLKKSHLESSAQVCVSMSSEYLQNLAIYNLSGHAVPVLGLSLTRKMCFLVVRGKLLHFSLYPFLLVLSLGTTEQSLDPSFLHLFFRFYTHIYVDDLCSQTLSLCLSS